jgi:hypothetical protein
MDQIGQAIASAKVKAAEPFRVSIELGSLGRVAVLLVPEDASADELLSIVGAISGQLSQVLAAKRVQGPKPRILVPQ